MKISLLITAWKEADSIGKCITTYIGDYTGELEILLACPDTETFSATKSALVKIGKADDLIWVEDEGVGKPAALNMLMEKASGDIWFFGDGDVFYGDNVIETMLREFTDDPAVQAVTGRPVSADKKEDMMGYWGHLLADAAHHKRTIDLTDAPQGRGKTFVKKRPFFPVSGYLFALKAQSDLQIPDDTLVDDAFISYKIHNEGGKIAYAPEAKVYVKYATNLKDYFAQKKRSVGGYLQLWKYGVVTKKTNSRSLGRELEYFWFPISYAQGLKQLMWSLLMYPTRLWLWLKIFWERKIRRKSFLDTWVRIESTK